MSVTETLQGVGSWGLSLQGVPQDIIDNLEYFGHVVIHTGRVDYRREGDAALTSGRYTGVVRSLEANDDAVNLGGAGMAMWLGDEDQKGAVIEDLITIDNLTFENTLRALLPASVTEGTLFNIGETFKGTFQYVSPREAIDYVCETLDAEWKVSGDARLYAGRASDLFVSNPKALVRRKAGGVDMTLRAYAGNGKTTQDVDDFTTRVVLLAQGTEASTVTASADILPVDNPYLDLHGNPLVMTRLVSESSTDASNAPARAQLQLNRFTSPADALELSTSDYDVKGDVAVGDYLWVLDDQIGLIDLTNEIRFKGQVYNPMKLRLVEMTWPVFSQMSVGYRDSNGKWYDLTDYLVAETGDTSLVVGDFRRTLGGATGGVVGSRPQPDTSVPDQPVWDEPSFKFSVYQSNQGETRAQVQLVWSRPDNTDGTSIMDGDHYEIRIRTGSTPLFPVTWAQLAGLTYDQVHNSGGTWDNPLHYVPGDWEYRYVPWSDLTVLIQDLVPNMPYEVQIRAVDSATPSNYGDWSDLAEFQTNGDTIAPVQPAPPEVYASRIAAQIVHRLGRSDGGEYNLDLDLHHLEVHGEYEPNFTPSDSTLLGKIIATNAFITGQVPAVGTVPIESTNPVWFKVIAVDEAGNASNPSVAVQQTAALIDNAHISDLSVTKVTAGTISTTWLLAGTIRTGVSGSRMEADINGLRLYNSVGTATVNLDAATGFATLTGTVQSGVGDQRIVINPEPAGIARIDWYDDGSTDHITAVNFGGNFLMQRETDAARDPDGGFLQYQTNASYFGHRYLPGNEAYVRFGNDLSVHIYGVWHDSVVAGNKDSIFCGTWDLNAASAIVGYGATMPTRMCPVVDVFFFNATINRHNIDRAEATQFGVRWDPSASVRLHYWVFRTDEVV